MNMLSDEELKKVIGGTLTPEALTWVNDHYDTLVERAKAAGFTQKEIDKYINLGKSPFAGLLGLAEVKSLLANNGIDVNGL